MKKLGYSVLLSLLTACGSSGPAGPTFDELIDEGWSAFTQGDYQTAAGRFRDAIALDPEDAEASIGLGWSLFKLDNLNSASSEFATASGKMNTTADLFAGWAFVLNAQKNYSQSNQRADQALGLDASWSFTFGLALDSDDLHLLKAQNHFLLGEFSESLSAVQILNPNFSEDARTSEGRAALALEIERLLGVI